MIYAIDARFVAVAAEDFDRPIASGDRGLVFVFGAGGPRSELGGVVRFASSHGLAAGDAAVGSVRFWSAQLAARLARPGAAFEMFRGKHLIARGTVMGGSLGDTRANEDIGPPVTPGLAAAYRAWQSMPLPTTDGDADLSDWRSDLVLADLWVANAVIPYMNYGRTDAGSVNIPEALQSLRARADVFAGSDEPSRARLAETYVDYLDLVERVFAAYRDARSSRDD